ncbi:hypothetical protein HRbin39_00251 [bacterium HR39]|nr:hypothetical protein HRbin39_00251 [bacterium HR39]
MEEHIGDRIRRRRVELGVTQEELAETLGVSYQQIQKYEAGTNRISAVYLHRIARRLGVPVEWFFEGYGEEGREPAPGASARLAQDLLRGFERIRSPAVRQALAALARTVAERQAEDGAGGTVS